MPSGDLRNAVAEQVALLPQCKLEQVSIPGTYMLDRPALGTPDAAGKLLRMGPKAIPYLVEALADTRKTQTLEFGGWSNDPGYRNQVNEIVARLIRELAQRDFVIGEMPQQHSILQIARTPELIPQFQKAVLDWYNANHGQTESEQKLAN